MFEFLRSGFSNRGCKKYLGSMIIGLFCTFQGSVFATTVHNNSNIVKPFTSYALSKKPTVKLCYYFRKYNGTGEIKSYLTKNDIFINGKYTEITNGGIGEDRSTPTIQDIRPQYYIESDNIDIKSLSSSLIKSNMTREDAVISIVDFVNKYLKYNDTNIGISSNLGALWAYKHKEGDCEDFSDLAVALLRADNIPAKPVLGGFIDPLNIHKINFHQWIEVRLHNKWVQLDPQNRFIWLPKLNMFYYSFTDNPFTIFHINKQYYIPYAYGYTGSDPFWYKGLYRPYGAREVLTASVVTSNLPS